MHAPFIPSHTRPCFLGMQLFLCTCLGLGTHHSTLCWVHPPRHALFLGYWLVISSACAGCSVRGASQRHSPFKCTFDDGRIDSWHAYLDACTIVYLASLPLLFGLGYLFIYITSPKRCMLLCMHSRGHRCTCNPWYGMFSCRRRTP